MKIQVSHLLPVTLMFLLAGMTLWLQYAVESPSPGTDTAKDRHDPDAIGKMVTIAKLDLHGLAQYHLSAERIVHYPDNDSLELIAPRFIRQDAGNELTVTADKGVLYQESKEARFYDNVEMVRHPLAGIDALQIRTEYMQVFMELGVARSDRAVNIVNGPSTLSGTGMEYRRDTGRFSVLSGVKGSFHVQKK
jgi:lipopolysaccharide export system protein LptC